MDYSEKLLDQLKQKGLYEAVIQHDLNTPLPFDDACFDAVICVGTLYQNQVRPLPALAQFVRVVKTGGLICFSLRLGIKDTEGYAEQMLQFVSEGSCEVVAEIGPFHGIVNEPEVNHKVFVYRRRDDRKSKRPDCAMCVCS